MSDQNNTPVNGNAPTTDTPNDNGNGGKGGEKTFTQDEVNQLIGKYRSESKSKAEADIAKAVSDAKAEWERQSKLTEDERLKEASAKREQELLNKEREIALRENTANAKEQLADKNIDTAFSKFLVTANAKETASNIDEFEKVFAKAVEKAVEIKLKGKTPEDKSHSTPTGRAKSLANGIYTSGNVKAF